MIILTSFFKRPKDIPAFSAARWQPRGFHLPEIRFLAPIDQFGKKLTGFIDEHEYRRLYKAVLKTRKEAVHSWLASLSTKRDLSLCCWCTIEQQKRKGWETIMCHRLLLGFTIRKHRPDIKVVVDEDLYLYSIWEHDFQCYDPRKNRRSIWAP